MYNLIELIKASRRGAAPGEGFKNYVTGAGTGIKMSDYKITAVAWSGAPNAPSAFTVYPSGTVFTATASFTRGSAAYNIQRQGSDAFTIWLQPLNVNDNLFGASVAISSFTNTGSGASMTLGITVTGKTYGSQQVQIYVSYPPGTGNANPPASGVLWEGSYGAQVSATGTPSYSDVYLNILYDPDVAAFNPTFNNYSGGTTGWPFRLEDRIYTTADFDWLWWDNVTDANNNNAATAYSTTASGGTWSSLNSTTQTRAQVWMRYRLKNGGSWSAVQTASINDTRLV